MKTIKELGYTIEERETTPFFFGNYRVKYIKPEDPHDWFIISKERCTSFSPYCEKTPELQQAIRQELKVRGW